MAATTIHIEYNLKNQLRESGKEGETYNEIIKTLLKKAKYVDFMDEQYAIIDNEKNWVSLDEL